MFACSNQPSVAPTVLALKTDLYEPPAELLLPCVRPNIMLLDLGEALVYNYNSYKTSEDRCATLHQSLIDWFNEARKAVAEPTVVK